MKRIIINLDEYNELKNNYELSKLEIEDLKDELKLCYSAISELRELLDESKTQVKELTRINKNRQNSIIHLKSYNKKLKLSLEYLGKNKKTILISNLDLVKEIEKLKKEICSFVMLIDDIRGFIIEQQDCIEFMSLFEDLIEERIGFMKYEEILKNGKN